MYDPDRHHRRSIRLPGYDYSRPGAYFVTLCVQDHVCLFGEVIENAVQLNRFGQIVFDCWRWLEEHYAYVQHDAWVIMPNHLRGIIRLAGGSRGGSRTAPTNRRKPLGRLIGTFKTVSTKRINELWDTPGERIWQRNFWERVVRNEREMKAFRRYIAENPQRWVLDSYHPSQFV